jgi:transcriptional regulator with XRE-family HTH domain
MTPQDFDFTVVARAGLTQKEFASLAGISRVTANMWIRGKMKPHRYIKAHAHRVINRLELAVQKLALPVPKQLKAGERTQAILVAFQQYDATAVV